MERLAHCKLGTEVIDHDPVKHGPTRFLDAVAGLTDANLAGRDSAAAGAL
jgi:hypothetical protein